MPSPLTSDLAGEFGQLGFCRATGVIEPSLIERLKKLAAERLASTEEAHFERYAHHGSLAPLKIEYDPLPDILMHAGLHETFRLLGFTDPRWISGYVIAKPPGSPGLWWHQDWWGWGHPRSYIRQATQIFCMIYLEPTTRMNGCLRVLQGTHLKRHRLHDVLPEPHSLEIESQLSETVSHAPVEDEIDILAEPGDLIIGDVRVIHATHPNTSDTQRTAVDLLFTPHFSSLPEEFKAHYVRQFCLPPSGWWKDPDHPLTGSSLSRILPTYDGDDPGNVEFCRRPRWPTGH